MNEVRSNRIKTDECIRILSGILQCGKTEIRDLQLIKGGMTNHSYVFGFRDERYLFRLPGEGTQELINRHQEVEVHHAIKGYGLCDDPVYIDAENGYKITRFYENARCCDPYNETEIRACMDKLKSLHRMRLEVRHSFDLYGEILRYESLCAGHKERFPDYEETKDHVMELKRYVDGCKRERVLSHIDAVPDNFLILDAGAEGIIHLTDWEYAGMQDPHLDIAMFAVYSNYSKEQADHLIDLYFEDEGGCDKTTRVKIYCYIAAAGLLWSNWTGYKEKHGIEYGAYGEEQYRYARDYCRYAVMRMDDQRDH